MSKFWKYIQYAYLIVGIIFFVDGVSYWDTNKEKSCFSFGFGIFIIMIFFFKRKFRKKVEDSNK